MSPGRFIGFLLLAPTVALAQGPVCNSQTQDTVACFAPAQNLQSTDILSGMQATGPQRSPQSVRVTPAQIVAAGGGGGGGSLTITDGTHTVTPTSNLTVIGATVGGTTPNATLTVSGGGSGISTITDGTHTVTGATSLTVTGATVGGTSPAPTLTVTGGGGGNVSNSGTPAAGQIASWVSTTTIQGNTTGTGILTALGVNVGSAGAPVINGGALGTPSSGNGSNLTNIPLGTAVTGILLGANGGTGVANTGKTLTLGGSLTTTGAATPTLAFGASTFTYTFPGATANLDYQVGSFVNGHCLQASGTAGGIADSGSACGAGGSVSITSLTPNIVVAPSPITGTGTVSSTVPLNTQSGASYAILTGDNTQLVEMTNASATTMTIPVANSAGFLSGWGTNVLPTLAATVLTPASGTACGLTSVSLDPGQFLGLAAGASTNYDCALGIPTSGTQNKVLATPNGSTGQPKLRALVAADLPSTAVTPGSYTSTNLTVDAQGRITAAANGTASAASITPGTTTIVGATAPCLIENSTSTTMACAAATAGNVTALGVTTGSAGAPVLFNGAGGTPSSMTGTNITGIPNAAVAAAPLPTPGTSATLVAPRSYYVCTGTCTVTLPTPAAGYEFCVRNDNNVATVITFAAITSVQFENTNFTSYKTANTSIVSGGAAGDKLCVMGRDATHYLVMSFNGTWS